MYIPIIQLKKYELAIKLERERAERRCQRGERETKRESVKEDERAPLGVILVFYKGFDRDRWVPLLSILLRECH